MRNPDGPLRLVLATKNDGKIREIREVLGSMPVETFGYRDLPRFPEVREDGTTFRENVLKKAHVLMDMTGLPVVADDSGLEVDALSGAPGVRSARYAGEHATDEDNIRMLLATMEHVPAERRTARFRCVLALGRPGGGDIVFDETCEGSITGHPHGTGGFGYDPVFYYGPLGKTFAQLPPQVKNTVSHRGKALRKLTEHLAVLV